MGGVKKILGVFTGLYAPIHGVKIRWNKVFFHKKKGGWRNRHFVLRISRGQDGFCI